MNDAIADLMETLPADNKLYTGTEITKVLKNVYHLFLDDRPALAKSQILELVTCLASNTQRRLLYEDGTNEADSSVAGFSIVAFIETTSDTIFAFLKASAKQDTGFNDDTFFMFSAYTILWDLEDNLDDHIVLQTGLFAK
ncbi:MAG: hypothetical protein ACI9H6_000656 [Patiriisocius sp.]|jgi:hypothetical protein